MTQISNEKIKQISEIYDNLCEEVRLVKRYSLPYNNSIETGKNYTSFKNLYLFLTSIGITDPSHIKLYIRSQFEELWKITKFKNKVIPINMMYNANAVERHIKYISEIKDKYKIYNNKSKLEKILDNITNSPLVYDSNCLSLSYDINSIYRWLIKLYMETSDSQENNFINVILFLESQADNGICPGYLITNSNIPKYIDSESINKKLHRIKAEIKNRGTNYFNSLVEKKNNIIERDIVPQLGCYDEIIRSRILKWL